jgi:predicted lysophospholipase L1 biosynthesis ABC-type transport system permease subunit
VVLVNATLADRFWPAGDAVGGRLVQDGQPSWGELEVIGVVGDVRFDDLRGAPEPIAYLPALSPVTPVDLLSSMWLVRAEVPPMSLARVIRDEVAALRPDLPVAGVATLEAVNASSTARLRMVVWLLGAVSMLAVTLSGLGVYGVVAYVASIRRRELGIRRALGARAADLRGLLIRQGAGAALAGMAVGLVGAGFMARALSGLLFEVPAVDPLTLTIVSVILGAAAFFAALVPAVHASRVDPAGVMQAD